MIQVGEIWADKDSYVLFLEYKLSDGRRFYLTEEKARPHKRPKNDDGSGILDENVDINGEKGVLYLNQLTTVVEGGYRYGWTGPNLYWQADGTELRINPRVDAVFTRDEIIAIARTLQRVRH